MEKRAVTFQGPASFWTRGDPSRCSFVHINSQSSQLFLAARLQRRIWNHLNQKQSQFPQCVIGIPAGPFALCCVVALSRGHNIKWAHSNTNMQPSVRSLQDPSIKKERKRQNSPPSFPCPAPGLKPFHRHQIRPHLWMVCVPPRRGGRRRRREN